MQRGKPFQKGNKAAVNRGKNKVHQSVKETFLAIFNELQDDPKINLTTFAKTYPRDFYNLASKLIPTELSAKVDHTVNLHIVRGKNNLKRPSPGTDTGATEPAEV